jgi:polyhydroxybutyrate depolymerase
MCASRLTILRSASTVRRSQGRGGEGIAVHAPNVRALALAALGISPTCSTKVDDTASESADEEGSGDEGSSTGDPESPGCGHPLPGDWFVPYATTWGGEGNLATVVVDGTVREYIIELPEPYDPAVAYPLVIAYHGNNSRMDNAYGQQLGRAFEFQAVVAYPQGLPGEGLDAIWRLQAESIDVDFFDALVDHIGERACIDRTRIHTWGYSRGGYFANLIACVRGDIVRGSSAAAAGMPLETEDCVGPVSHFFVRGMDDEVVPEIEPRLALQAWLALDGCSEQWTPAYHPDCKLYDDCSSDASVVYCEVPGVGHVLQQDIAGMEEAAVAFLRSL